MGLTSTCYALPASGLGETVTFLQLPLSLDPQASAGEPFEGSYAGTNFVEVDPDTFEPIEQVRSIDIPPVDWNLSL